MSTFFKMDGKWCHVGVLLLGQISWKKHLYTTWSVHTPAVYTLAAYSYCLCIVPEFKLREYERVLFKLPTPFILRHKCTIIPSLINDGKPTCIFEPRWSNSPVIVVRFRSEKFSVKIRLSCSITCQISINRVASYHTVKRKVLGWGKMHLPFGK